MSALATALAALNHPASRRTYRVAEDADFLATEEEDQGWRPLGGLLTREAVVEQTAADPVASLGIAELTGTMAFHALAVPLVDLVVGLVLVANATVDPIPGVVLVRFQGPSVIEVALDPSSVLVANPTAEEIAIGLAGALDPLVAAVEPHDAALRWGALADLICVVAGARLRAHGLDADNTWDRAESIVAGLRSHRPHPTEAPSRLGRRSTCCEWYRAARHLGEPSVADARCADCPSLDPAVNASRLAALAEAGDLANP